MIDLHIIVTMSLLYSFLSFCPTLASFRSQQMCSYSNLCMSRKDWSMILSTLHFNRIPQFKHTARSTPWSKRNREEIDQPKRVCLTASQLAIGLLTTNFNISQNQLPSFRAYHSLLIAVDGHYWEMRQFWSKDKHRQSIWVCAMHVTRQDCLNFSNALLIRCTFFSTV